MDHFYDKIQGWRQFHELYSQKVREAKENSTFVEIGSWLGKSAVYMAVEILNSGKKIQFDCVDTWRGSVEHQKVPGLLDDSIYLDFLKNIKPVRNIIFPIRTDSLKASTLYEDNSLDFVFIDASHQYIDVKNDIAAWYPKVKIGGTLAGHDYSCSKGVTQAVHEFFKKKEYALSIKSENCWGIIKV
jgi:predicted O-methyltransferase YrrM